MPGFDTGSVMYALNVDFTGTSLTSGSAQVTQNGQLLIGSTVLPNIRVGTLTGGTGITIVNGPGTITINGSGASMTWSDAAGTFTAATNHGYFITGASTPTMPLSANIGDVVAFILDAGATLTITANAGQVLRLGSTASAAAGTCVSSTQGNAITFIFRTTDTTWLGQSSVGTWSIT